MINSSRDLDNRILVSWEPGDEASKRISRDEKRLSLQKSGNKEMVVRSIRSSIVYGSVNAEER